MTKATSACLPASHIASLHSLEKGYWWYVGRVHWATRLMCNWLGTCSTSSLSYVDLGCGTGGFARKITERFAFKRVALVDHDPAMIRRIPELSRYEILERDLSNPYELPWQPDVISCMDVLEHMEKDEAFLEQAFRHLRPGGLLLMSVPAHQILFSDWDKYLGHHRRYNKKGLKQRLQAAGFMIREMRYMWSFLAPIAPYRKWKGRKNEEDMEFPKVSKLTNSLLISASKFEFKLGATLPAPFGTSLILSATKP